MTINYYNEFHLGDCTFHILFMRKILRYGEYIKFNFYVNHNYEGELNSQLENEEKGSIKILPLNERPSNAINCWIGRDNYYQTHSKHGIFNEFYAEWFTKLAREIGFDIYFDKNCILYNSTKSLVFMKLSKHTDYLIVNSTPLSGQFQYNEGEFNDLIKQLHYSGKSIVTTKKVIPEIPCTLEDYGLNLSQIGSVSMYAKKIIAINTSPIIPCFNIWNIDIVEKWYVLANDVTYSYNDRIERINSIADLKNKIC